MQQTLGQVFPSSLLSKLSVKPIRINDGTLYCASVRPLQTYEEQTLISIARKHGVTITSVVQEAHDSLDTLSSIFASPTQTGEQFIKLLQDEDNRSIPGDLDVIIDSLIADAIEHSASDIHIEAADNFTESNLSYRIGNNIVVRTNVKPALAARIATIIRERAKIDTSNTAAPADGDFRVFFQQRPIDLRVAVLPTTTGQKLTLRIADPAAFTTLGDIFSCFPRLQKRLQTEAEKATRRGNIGLVTGPTNQGKSTTLRAMTLAIPRHRARVMEIGEPVEVTTPLVTQTHVNDHPAIDLNFSNYLKSVLRHDPDVVSPSELRDERSVQAMLRIIETGHQVLTTLHADSAVATFPRLFSLISERRAEAADILSQNLTWILHQRLVSTPCRSCSTKIETKTLDPETLAILKPTDDQIYVISLSETGCADCYYTGTQGRTLAPEVIWFNRSCRAAVSDLFQNIADGSAAPRFEKLLDIPGVDYISRVRAYRELARLKKIAYQTALESIDGEPCRD
jgi:type II secretory ATPase GspE/PulE/Tfp pilus assembly ATPase PilB-like protein